MKKFLVLYRMNVEEIKKMMASSTPESQKQSMDEWKAWMEANMSSFADGGAPAGKNTQVTAAGISDVSNDIGGYAIMQGESKEAVTKVISGSPHLHMPSAMVDVMEILPM